MKLIDLIDEQAARLEESGVSFGQGTLSAFDEAAWLALWALSCPLDDLDGVANRELTLAEQTRVRDWVQTRITQRRPTAYLTGEAWLQGVPFHVDDRVIIPRSLIAECLADGTIDALLGREPDRVLDLCTGNGSLAILAALAWPQAQVDGADLNGPALEVAAINRQRHGLQSRIDWLQGDGLAAVAGRHYDLILCNPPYVNASSMAALPPEFQAEPALALHGGTDGMDFIRPLIAQAADHLRPGGWLVLEIGHERPHFEAAFPRLPALWLETSGGDDAVLALAVDDLRATP